MPQRFHSFQSRCLDRASAVVALSAAAKCSQGKGGKRCIVVVGADLQLLAHLQPSGSPAPSNVRMMDRARRAAILLIETDGIGSEQGPELAALNRTTYAHGPTALAICCDGRLIGAIGVTSQSDTGNHDVAEAGRSALLRLFAGEQA